MHVVLYQPEIPPNTGNVSRQCVGMNAHLHLVGPIRFDLSSGAAKRAGLDYWEHLSLTVHESPSEFLQWLSDRKPWIVTRHGSLRYDVPRYRDGDILIFGSETRGLPPQWLDRWKDRAVYVPMLGPVRSYNLSNTVAVVLAQASLTAGIFE